MKKILFVLSMLAFVVCALPQARGDDVSVDFFYNNLSGGNWIDVEGYGYGWQPDVAVSDPNWRPYSDGYWAYTDYGWTWISYEDFGWATYHYGRWANLADNGWVWIPGSDLDWGPAWVSWRTGGDYIGWAPLPPRGADVVYEGQPIGASVDVEYDIGPQYYNFCDIRFIGEPVLRDRIFPPTQNITYITNTVNVTNIYVQNNVVYNYGPNYNVVNEYSSRPIQRLTIERQTAGDLSAAAKSGALTKVQGNKLVVAAPLKLAKSPLSVAPPAVKAKVAQPKIEHGWKGVSNRAEVEQKIKAENPKNIPPPTRAAARTAGSPPAVGASPPAAPGGREPVSPGPRGKPGRVPPGATAVPAGISPSPFERGKPKPGATATPAGISPSPFERGKPKPGARPGATTSPSSGAGGRENIPPQRRGGEPERERFGTPPPAGAGAHERRGPEQRPQPAVRQPVTPPPTGAPPAEARGARERAQGAYGQPGGPPPPRGGAPAAGGPARGGAPAAGAERGQEQPQHGKKQPEKGTPRPGPQ